jgi:periplasmic copper chaperone A
MRLRGPLTVALAVGIAVFGFAAAAQAHVTIDPTQAQQGGYTRIAFRVPAESDTASTTKLDVFLDPDHPVASVATLPVPGWTVTVATKTLATPLTDDDGNKITEAPSQITWTATGDAAIKPGQFQEFPVSMGPLPKTNQLVLKVLQTYSDGTVVRWIDATVAGQAEPEHPAPVLTLTAAGAEGAGTAPAPSAAPAAPAATAKSSNAVPIGLGVAGIVLGLAGLVLGALAYGRTRRPAAANAQAAEAEPATTPATTGAPPSA